MLRYYRNRPGFCQAAVKVLQFPPMVPAIETCSLSVIAPVYNEAPNIQPLYEQITAALDGIVEDYEIVLVDDGSSDGSFERMEALSRSDPRLKVIQFRRNFGQSAAFAAGFDYARGDVIVTLDADLQNDPADIPLLLAKLDEGYDVVAGWRQNRKDNLVRKIPSFLANRLIARTTGVMLHDTGCSLRAYRRPVVENVKLYGEMHRFIPALASLVGIRLAELPVNHRPRSEGDPKYGRFGLGRAFRVVLDLLTIYFMLGFFGRPMHLFGGVGLVSAALGFGISLYLSALKVFAGRDIGDRPLLLLGVLLIVIGVQFLAMGLLGELIVRTYYESQGKPPYYVRTVLPQSEE
jgi:glycosyltransferase involved in cell wall biosynthesis